MKRSAATPASRKWVAWTPQEDAKIVSLYPEYAVLLQELPHRTYSALRQRARHLGIVRPRHVWTNREVERLRDEFSACIRSNDIANLFPYLRKSQVFAKVRHLNLAYGRRLKEFDHPVLSTIRARATQMKLTLKDLDKRARSGRYFQKSNRTFQLRPAVSAVAALNGQTSIEWEVH